MRALLIFLLFPCCLHAQLFAVKVVRPHYGSEPTYSIWLGKLDGTMIVTLNITDKIAPLARDSVFYDGHDWLWHKHFLHLYNKPVFEALSKREVHDGGRYNMYYMVNDPEMTEPNDWDRRIFKKYVEVMAYVVQQPSNRKEHIYSVTMNQDTAIISIEGIETMLYWTKFIKIGDQTYQVVNYKH